MRLLIVRGNQKFCHRRFRSVFDQPTKQCITAIEDVEADYIISVRSAVGRRSGGEVGICLLDQMALYLSRGLLIASGYEFMLSGTYRAVPGHRAFGDGLCNQPYW